MCALIRRQRKGDPADSAAFILAAHVLPNPRYPISAPRSHGSVRVLN